MNILVIDDDTTKTDLFELLIDSYPYNVTRINSQGEWLLEVVHNHPDVIILDITSPDVENFPICEKIRSQTRIPILVVSVVNTPELIAKALDAGADDVLTKPVSESLLTARLNGLTARCKGNKRFFGHSVSQTP